MIKVAEPDGRDYKEFLRLLIEYERNHVARWRGASPQPEHEVRVNCARYLDELTVLLSLQGDTGHGFLVTGEKKMYTGERSAHVGYVYHIFSKISGTGTELMESAEGNYRKEGFREMGLHVHAANVSVLPFFQKNGYVVVKRGNSMVAMLKELQV